MKVADEIAAAEEKIREAVLRGERLDETRKKLRYHALQTREASKP